jgi:hypothetical protein
VLTELIANIKEQASAQAVFGTGLIGAYFALILGAAAWRIRRRINAARPPRYKPKRGEYF